MNMDWIKQLNKKPDKREKIVFLVMMVVILAMTFNFWVLEDIRAIDTAKVQIKEATLKPVKKPKQPVLKENRWVGTIEAVREAPEAILSPFYLQRVKIAKTQFSSLSSEVNRQKRDVTLSVVGDYAALQQYLNYLENMPAPLVIHNFSIQKSAPDSDVLNLEISGVVYGAN